MAILSDTHGHTIVTTSGHPRAQQGLARLSQFIDYAFWLLYSLLFIRLLLVFFGANAGAGFARFIADVTNLFYAPFRGIVPNQPIEGGFLLAVPIAVAIVVYALLHLAIRKLIRVAAYRRITV